MSPHVMRLGLLMMLIALSGFLLLPAQGQAQDEPYPPSPIISDITFDWSTHERHAPGSDNWPITWGEDGHQYTAWGDGGGFGGTNEHGRVSLGVAVVKGRACSYAGYNQWGGEDPAHPATFAGKSYGIPALGKELYMWVSPGSDAQSYREARLYRSTNQGASWTVASWAFKNRTGSCFQHFYNSAAAMRSPATDGYTSMLTICTTAAI
jgi:hypothetical protein